MMKNPWYFDFFHEDYPRLYAERLNSDHTGREVNFIEGSVPIKSGSSILDLCCGEGRHSIELAKRGYKVTGQDLSSGYIQSAKLESKLQNLDINFVEADMTSIEGYNQFDLVINMFTSFGYLPTDSDNSKVLNQIHKSLKPEGYLILDTLNHAWVMANQVENDEFFMSDGTRVIEHRSFDYIAGRNHIWFDVEEGAKKFRQIEGHHIRLYTLVELIKLLNDNSLEFIQVHGGYNQELYSAHSQRMIVVAKK
tara:strand:+ start:4681 stop:5433 length:753 start_codon:yes stop_codon:yes gene_type:complete